MSIYFLLAVVLGALSAVGESPVTRPAMRVVRSYGLRAESESRRSSAGRSRRVRRGQAPAAASLLGAWRVEFPLTGGGTPRAPSRNR